MAQHSPDESEFGHVCETPEDWEQRFEKINFHDRSHQGKVLKIYFLYFVALFSYWGSPAFSFMRGRSVRMRVYRLSFAGLTKPHLLCFLGDFLFLTISQSGTFCCLLNLLSFSSCCALL